MGRAHEVRASSMAKTAAKKSMANGRASKEIYMAAKQGTDPDSNLTLRSLIEKAKSNQIPRDVIERAIKRAQGGDAETYISNRYEGMGPGNSSIIVDALTDNVNRAAANIREVFNKNHGNPEGKVSFLFKDIAYFAFEGNNVEEILDGLLLEEVEVEDVLEDDGAIEVIAPFKAFSSVKNALEKLGIKEFLFSDIRTVPTDEYIEITNKEEKEQLEILLDKLDNLEDVQNVYHNVKL